MLAASILRIFICKCVCSELEGERLRPRGFLLRRDPEDFNEATDDAVSSAGQAHVSGGLHESERLFLAVIDHSVVLALVSFLDFSILGELGIFGVSGLCVGGSGKSYVEEIDDKADLIRQRRLGLIKT